MRRLPRLLFAAGALVALTTAAAPGWGPYAVRSGDTLWGLARTHHTTVAALQRANHLHGDLIYVGQRLNIPGNGAPATAQQRQGGAYTVRAGDTLSSVARAHGVGLATLAALNHLSGPMTIYIGQHLRLPTGATTGSSRGGYSVYAAAPVSNAFRGAVAASAQRLSHVAQPGRTQIAQLVAGEARRQGVSPALAMAIAYQESGFSQRMVSGTDAVGVMQLQAYTATWLAEYTGTRIDRYTVAGNIRGGVTLLRVLRQQASVTNTIAGYYQGLASVQARGMFSDTRAYVRNVQALEARFS